MESECALPRNLCLVMIPECLVLGCCSLACSCLADLVRQGTQQKTGSTSSTTTRGRHMGHTPRTIFNMHRGTELVWNVEDLVIVKVIVRYNMRVQQGEACSRNFQPQCRLLPKELQGRHVEVPVYEKIAASRWHNCAHTPNWEEHYVPHKDLFFQMDYDKVKNLTPLSCCFPWAPQPTNVKARAAAFTACLDHSRSPRGGSPSSLAATPTVAPSMEQETPTLQPEEPTVTQLPVEECQQEPASPTPFLPMPKSAAATQLDTDMDKEQEEVPAWFNCSPTSPADHMQEDDDGLQQQLQRAEHLTMTLDRVNVRDSDSELSGISDEDDEEEPDDKMSQKDEDQDEHQDEDEWRWMPLESGRWQGAQLLRLERQWQDAGFPKLGTEAGDWFHTQITAAETAYVTATGIYDHMPDPGWWNCGGAIQDSTAEDAVARENAIQEIPNHWAALQNSGKPESDKETRAGAQDAFQRHLHLYTMGRCWFFCRAVPPAATGAKIPQGPTLVQLPGTMA